MSRGQYEPLDADHSTVREGGFRDSPTKAKKSGWAGIRQRARRYLLSNVYVPLVRHSDLYPVRYHCAFVLMLPFVDLSNV